MNTTKPQLPENETPLHGLHRIIEQRSERLSPVDIERLRRAIAALAALTPQAASEGLREAFERAMKASWKMVNPRESSASGSYFNGQNNGMIAALQTVRENYEREVARLPAIAPADTVQPWPKFVQDEVLEILRNVDTQFRAAGQASARIERAINMLAAAPAIAPAGRHSVTLRNGTVVVETSLATLPDGEYAVIAALSGAVTVDEAMVERAEAYMLRVLPGKTTARLGGTFNFYELLTAALAPAAKSSGWDDTCFCRECREQRALARAGSPFAGEPLPDHDPTKSNAEQGLYRKFDVRRTDGSDQPGGKHHGCEYFVLDIRHDPLAKPALAAYAAAARPTHPDLSRDLIERYALAAGDA